jgi:hypothetical protein
VELREQLVNINITFANEIISLQYTINQMMEELFDEIGKILGLEYQITSIVKPRLKPPVILLLQMLESVLSSITNIQQAFTQSGVPYDPYYILNKYVPQLDWEEFKDAAEAYNVKKKATAGEEEQSGGRF